MNKHAFIIDIGRCENCNNCHLSCKDEHVDNLWPGYSRPQPPHGQRWMEIRRRERGRFPDVDVAYLPRPCMHCDDAPCIAAGAGAITKRGDGLVLIDPEKARGRRELANVCPYGAIFWNEGEQLAQKCTGCAHLLDEGWAVPRCVQACPTGALSLFTGTDVELDERVAAEGLAVLPETAENGGRPRCYYRNLHRFTHCFIAGSLARTVGGVDECLGGAGVVLEKDGRELARTVSDDFGDFKFDGLAPGSGRYRLRVEVDGWVATEIEVRLAKSVSVGTVHL